jgi:chloride channel protein, CIC family
MSTEPRIGINAGDRQGDLLTLALLAPIVGAGAGLIGAAFRLALAQADRVRNALIAWAHGGHFAGLVLVTVTGAAAVAFAAWLVRRFWPGASGSGIPHVEAQLEGELPEQPFGLIPIKFIGGLLAIGAGLALGREGPSVQMGASVGDFVGRIFRRSWPDRRVLLAAGAGAGLATAFNAPIAGAIFVLEELVRRFEPRIAIVALGVSATAIAVARMLLVDAPDFHIGVLAYAPAGVRPLYFVLGAVAGLVAILYNRALIGTIAAADRLTRWPVEARAALIGASISMLAWFAPGLVGGGDAITQRTLNGTDAWDMVALIFFIRFGLGTVSYAARTPGGLFAPLLVLGAQLGLLFGVFCRLLFPDLYIQPEGFAVVGMAALFTGVVRAPITGIVLVVEMTASVTMLLPMLGACFAAMLVPTLLRAAPIYESLRGNVVGQPGERASSAPPE